uniref:hypothetical protein n=1 Tax=Streptomyces roseicoloratus TaxID=2508722 RepID=UPI0035A5A6AD
MGGAHGAGRHGVRPAAGPADPVRCDGDRRRHRGHGPDGLGDPGSRLAHHGPHGHAEHRPARHDGRHGPGRPAGRPRTTAPGGSGGGTGTGSGTASGNGSGDVKSYGTDGGRVVFDLGPSSAELVSAVPGSGWQMQVWKQPTWIRVTFTKDSREISVFCLWHDTAPRVEIDER